MGLCACARACVCVCVSACVCECVCACESQKGEEGDIWPVFALRIRFIQEIQHSLFFKEYESKEKKMMIMMM